MVRVGGGNIGASLRHCDPGPTESGGGGLGLSVLADNMAAAAWAQLNPPAVEIAGVTASTIALPGGRVCHRRRFAFERHGVASIARIVCFIDDGLAVTLAASWIASEDTAESEVDAALASIRLMSRPIATFASAIDPNAKVPSVKRPPVDGSAWTGLRIARLDPDVTSLDADEATCWSPAELAVCATILGAATFPTVGPDVLGSLPAAVLNATLDTVTRSFMARGVTQPGEDGWATLHDGLRVVMEGAVFPDLAISVERIDAAGTRLWWLGLRPVGGNPTGVGLAPSDSPLIVSSTGGGSTGLTDGGVVGLPPMTVSVIAGSSLFAADPNGYMGEPAGNQFTGHLPQSSFAPTQGLSSYPMRVAMETRGGIPAPTNLWPSGTFPT